MNQITGPNKVLSNLKLSPFLILTFLYLFTLVFSWIVEYNFPVRSEPLKYEHHQVVSDEGEHISMSYYLLEQEESAKTIILLPDVLYDKDFLLPLALLLQERYNVIIPLYPLQNVEGEPVSHSINSRAGWVKSLSDSLHIENAHVSGHGYGGLVAIRWLSELGDNTHASLTLLSAFGVQELNFLGNYTLNRSLYSLLYPVVAIYKYGIPHFGGYDKQSLNSSYVRTKAEMDQRGIRESLGKITLPALVLHAYNDRYIPLSTGEESHRLLPQSYFITENARHVHIEEHPEIWSRHFFWFLDVAEADEAPIRANAPEERIQLSKEPFDADKLETISGWALLVIILLLALSTLISEDLSCIGGGLVVASGLIDFWFAVLGCFSGILIADVGTYFLGRWVGRPVIGWVPFRWFIKQRDMQRIEQMFEMRGVEIIFITRFLPGTRFPTYLTAGMLKTDFTFFLGYFILAIAIWTPLLVGISAVIGQPMLSYLEIYQDYALWIILAIALMIYSLIKVVLPLATVKGRREFYVKLLRLKKRYYPD
ncbi:MAG: VTT domain-containing protein [Balneolaceae bacterium]